MRRVKEDTRRPGRLAGGAAVLAAGSMAAKFIGAFYRIPLTNILGAEGMGVYQLVFPVYALFITLSTAGIPTALSRIVAEHRARGESAGKYLAAALFTLVALSVLAGGLITALSHVFARWQGNPAAAGGYAVIAPAVFFAGLVAGFRGWFQGEMYMLPTALSGIVEQLVKLGVGVGLAAALAPRGQNAAVMGAIAGVTVSELAAACYLAVTCAENIIQPSHLPFVSTLSARAENDNSLPAISFDGRNYKEIMKDMEAVVLRAAMHKYGNIANVARELQVDRSTIFRKVKELEKRGVTFD